MIGTVIADRYEIRAPLGEGGMATLYRAHDRHLDREVAIKVLRAQYGRDPGFAARFRQEARSAGALSHPNIVGVYDYGTSDESQFIVMELVEGRDLASLISERGRLPPDEAVSIAVQVASALEAAHRRGIVHRDVKPGNVLITDDGNVKVTDFGIARALSEASMTLTGTTLGSVHYFSPEQARGDEVNGASDVYSLGIVLYEMLTGRRPFEGDSAAGVALKRLTEDPPPPSVYDRSLPAGLVAIVMRALARDAVHRFPSAAALGEALLDWERDPQALPAAVPLPPRRPPTGEATIYLPPPVAPPQNLNVAAVPGAPPVAAPRYAEDEPVRGQPWWIWLLLVLALALLFAVGFLGVRLLSGLTPGTSATPAGNVIELPDWRGDPITSVRLQADEMGIVLDVREEPHEDVEENAVIRTEPGPGAEVARGSTVTVFVSLGPELVEVPQLFGQTREEAIQRLQNRGLDLGAVNHEPSDQPVDTVLRSDPAAGSDVESGTSVNLILSSGPTPSPTPSPTPVPTPTPTPTPVIVTPTPTPTPTP